MNLAVFLTWYLLCFEVLVSFTINITFDTMKQHETWIFRVGVIKLLSSNCTLREWIFATPILLSTSTYFQRGIRVLCYRFFVWNSWVICTAKCPFINYSAELNSRSTISGTIIASFLQKSCVVGSGELWNGVYLPTCEKKLLPFLDMSFTGLSCRWKKKDFLKSV